MDALSAERLAGIPDMDKLVDKFLCWRLPKDFNPDGGISFKAPSDDVSWPVGTNLLDATQAKRMLEYLLADFFTELFKERDALLREKQAVEEELETRRVIFKRLHSMPESEAADAYERERIQLYENTERLLNLIAPKVMPSCLVCGQQKEFAVRHIEAVIGVCTECHNAVAQLAAAEARVKELTGELPGNLAGERALNDEKCRCFYERATKAEDNLDRMRAALEWVLAFTQKPDYFPNEGDAQWWTEQMEHIKALTGQEGE